MDRTAIPLDPAPASLNALELRVLDGPQAGARAPLPAGTACVVAAETGASGRGADIVLRDEHAAPARVRVTAELDHALIEVLDGEVTLGEQVLAAGAHAPWPRHAPLRIGSSVVAFGLACEDRWNHGDSAEETPASTEAQAPAPLRQRAEVWLGATGAAILLACGGTLWMAHVAAATAVVRPVDQTPLAVALKSSEFSALELVSRAGGQPVLHGRLTSLAQRARLDSWLGAHQATPVVDVQTDEAVAREVTEVFRINGVTVQAHAADAGRIVVDAAEHDGERLARAEEVVRRDVHGFDKLTVNNSAAPLLPPEPPIVDDPGKRITSLVPGEPAYVVTVDGTHYFVGSLLPSGYRITQVAEQRVTVERDGRRSTLNF